MTIVELITSLGAQLRVFDLGRRIQAIDGADFVAIENQYRPYPTPYLKHAWLGILSWSNKTTDAHNIWFLKLPLDEQNMLQVDARDAFVKHWLTALQSPQASQEAPFNFKPDANRMAYFHALALQSLGQAPTAYYASTRRYLTGEQGFEQWQKLGLQGLAEVVVRLDEDGNQALVQRALPHIPAVVRNVLLGFMENISPDQALTSVLNDCLAQAVAQGGDVAELAAFARALSHSLNIEQRQSLLSVLLQHPLRHRVELLAAIAKDCWQDLQGALLQQFLEALARNEEGAGAFHVLVADMLALPDMRQRVLQVLAQPTCSSELSQAFTALLASVQAQR